MSGRQNVVAFIFARGGSKGLPRKNIMQLAGKPLIAHTIEMALEVTSINRVIVSTDDKEIAEVALKAGAEVPFIRPAELASDNAPEWLSWRHAIEYLKSLGESVDVFISLPATAPLRSKQDIECCIDTFDKFNPDMVITVREAERNPYFNMVKKKLDGTVQLVLESDYYRRQDAPVLYDMTTVAYVTTPEYIAKSTGHFKGNVMAVLIPRERALDIDTKMDMVVAEALIRDPIFSEPSRPIF